MDTMRVYHLTRPGVLRLESAPVPEPTDGELVARVSIALTCGTDLKTFRRGHARLRVPGLLGHEWAGTVEAIGAGVTDFQPGDRIVAAPTAPCGDCAYCLKRLENLCLHLFDDMALGAYGDYILVPRQVVNRNAYRIPDSLSDVHAAFLEPLACTVHGADLLNLGGDRSVVFVGDGSISLLFAQVARLRGSGRVILVGKHAERLDIARNVGVDHVIDASATDVEAAIEMLTDGLGADTVVECVGRPEAWQSSVALVRKGGEVLFFGGCEKGALVALDSERIHYDEINLKGGFHYTPDSVRRAWELIGSSALALDPLVTHEMKLEELPDAFERMSRREAVKVAIKP
jgi:L-iditol 2-dehydrogenase